MVCLLYSSKPREKNCATPNNYWPRTFSAVLSIFTPVEGPARNAGNASVSWIYFCSPAFIDRIKVLSLPHVVDIVGSKNIPAIVSPEEIDFIKNSVNFGHATPYSALMEGQPVIVTSGVLCGMRGTLLRNQNKSRVIVIIHSIARSFAVDIDISCLTPVEKILFKEPKLFDLQCG